MHSTSAAVACLSQSQPGYIYYSMYCTVVQLRSVQQRSFNRESSPTFSLCGLSPLHRLCPLCSILFEQKQVVLGRTPLVLSPSSPTTQTRGLQGTSLSCSATTRQLSCLMTLLPGQAPSTLLLCTATCCPLQKWLLTTLLVISVSCC
jgi:hypothetical protein